MSLRLWSSTYVTYYCSPCLSKGLLAYCRAYSSRRILDFLGILFFMLSILCHCLHFNITVIHLLRLLEILQIYQANRLLYSYMRIIFHTIIGSQWDYIQFTFYLAFMMMTFSSVTIYFTESYFASNGTIRSIFDSLWFVFETFTTIGYDSNNHMLFTFWPN